MTGRPSVGELAHERARDLGPARGHDDAVERRVPGEAERPVADVDVDVVEAEAREPLGGHPPEEIQVDPYCSDQCRFQNPNASPGLTCGCGVACASASRSPSARRTSPSTSTWSGTATGSTSTT